MNNVIEVKKLSAGYDKKIILDNVSFNVEKGEMVGIIGANGAGKSTLLKTMRGMLPKISGNVLVFAKDVETFSECDFAQHVAYLQQQVEVSFGYTSKELVLAGRYPYLKWWESESTEDEKIAEMCMEYTGVLEFADRPITQLSGGQKQRVLLAKVLAQKTPVLFLDEPTTGLDIVYQEEIFKFCQALCKAGKTVLMVAHELNLAAKFCSRLLLIGDGKILADGVPLEVMDSDHLTRAYKVPVEVIRNPVSGGIEITTRPLEEDVERKEFLIDEICREMAGK